MFNDAKEFFSDPYGLSVGLGTGIVSYRNFGKAEITNDANSYYLSPGEFWDSLHGIWVMRLDLAAERSYATIRCSPYWNSNQRYFYLDAKSGFQMHESDFFQASLYFYGMVISSTTPVVGYRQGTNETNYFLVQGENTEFNGGLGVVNAGMGIEAFLRYEYEDVFEIALGAYFEAGSFLPFTASLGLGLAGPNFTYYIIPESLGIFFDCRLYRIYSAMNYYQAGLEYIF
jgi:hypothetical protein